MSAIERKRGDTKAIVFRLWEDKEAGTPLDITAFTFKFTVNKLKAPTVTDTPEFTLVGEIVGAATDGRMRFLPSAAEMDLPPTNAETGVEYFFDFEVTDAEGLIGTEMLDKFKVVQDITK